MYDTLLRSLGILAATLSLCASSYAQRTVETEPSPSKKTLLAALQNLTADFGGTIGVYAKHLKTGETIALNADTLFTTASTIKLPLLVALEHEFHTKRLAREQRVSVVDSVRYGGAGVLQSFIGAESLSLLNIAILMIIISDNSATNLVIDGFGTTHDEKLSRINRIIDSLGFHATRLQNKSMSGKTRKSTTMAQRYGLGVSTPRDMGVLLEQLAEKKLISESASDEMLRILMQQNDNTKLRRYLPDTLRIANKTGEVSQSKSDVGIVYSPSGTYVISLYTDLSQRPGYEPENAALMAVAKASRLVYDYFNPASR
jgi:beta-lactamase class A